MVAGAVAGGAIVGLSIALSGVLGALVASVAVVSLLSRGRDEVNYSEFGTDPGEVEETTEVILDGSMPPGHYTVFGPASRSRPE